MKQEKVIVRNHNFENRLNMVRKSRKYFYMTHEKSSVETSVCITPEGEKAFDTEDWNYFVEMERQYYGKIID